MWHLSVQWSVTRPLKRRAILGPATSQVSLEDTVPSEVSQRHVPPTACGPWSHQIMETESRQWLQGTRKSLLNWQTWGFTGQKSSGDGGDSCTILQMYLGTLNCTRKMVKWPILCDVYLTTIKEMEQNKMSTGGCEKLWFIPTDTDGHPHMQGCVCDQGRPEKAKISPTWLILGFCESGTEGWSGV